MSWLKKVISVVVCLVFMIAGLGIFTISSTLGRAFFQSSPALGLSILLMGFVVSIACLLTIKQIIILPR